MYRFLDKVFGSKSRGDAGKHEVSFSLRLKERPYQVAVAGSFNHWSCFSHPLRLSPSGAWEARIRLAPGTHRYRFFIDNSKWILDPSASAVSNECGGMDSLLFVARPEIAPINEGIPKNDGMLVEQCA